MNEEAIARGKVWEARRDRRLWPEGVVTLFVDNLHGSTDTRSLEDVFTRHGRIWDVFIPKKRRVGRSDIFGFVRVGSRLEAKEIIHKCDGYTLFGRKMGVKLASFGWEKRRVGGGELGGKTGEKKQGQIHLSLEGKRINLPSYRDNRAYGEVLMGKRCRGRVVEQEELEDEVTVPVAEEAVDWLTRCAVGILKSADLIPDLMIWAEREKHVAKKIRLMGGEKALVEFHSKEQMGYNISSSNHQLHRWFSTIKAWSPEDERRGRRLWLRCMDVPLHVWGERFFRMIGNYWGRTIMIDQKTINREEIEVGRIFIATEEIAAIKATFKICVEGESYMMRVAEEETSERKIESMGIWHAPSEPEPGRPVGHSRAKGGAERVIESREAADCGSHTVQILKGGTNPEVAPKMGKRLVDECVREVSTGSVGDVVPSLNEEAHVPVCSDAHGPAIEKWRMGRPNDSGKSIAGVDEGPDELRSIFVLPQDEVVGGSHIQYKEVSRVPDTPNTIEREQSLVAEREAVEEDSDEETGLISGKGRKGGWRRNSIQWGSTLRNHLVNLQRARKGKKKKRKARGGKSLAENSVDFGANDQIEGTNSSESEVEGANKSVSDDTVRRMNERAKPKCDAAWIVGKSLGMNYLGNEEVLIKKFREAEDQEVADFEEGGVGQ